MSNKLITKWISAAALVALVSLGFVVTSLAQAGTTGVSGTVRDQNGAAVPGATARLINPATGFERTVTTSAEGKYAFPGIPPATYRLEVEAGNFKKLVNSKVQALVDLPTEVNVTLEPGAVTAVVDVTTDNIEAIVNTQDASLGNNFEPNQITQLPSDLRRVPDLLTLQPGVTREGYVAGGRSDQANITLDGIDINDQQNGGRPLQADGLFQAQQGTVLRVLSESLEEFRITTSNPNANQGRSSGAQISLITKSGTNDFRGSGFYFYRPTAFSANSFFNNLAGVPRPSLARDVFGGSVGGPIKKDRLFFFYAYEGQREQQALSVVQVVPLPHVGQGQIRFSGTGPSCTNGSCVVGLDELNNSIYPLVGINPLAVAALASAVSRYPANDTSVGDGVNTGGFRFNSPTTDNENTHVAKFDLRINDKHSLYLRGNYQHDLEQQASYLPDTPSTSLWEHPYGFAVGHNWALSNNKFNNFRYGLTRQAFSNQGDSSDPGIVFRFVFAPVNFTRTLSRVTPVHNFTDDFTWITGNHSFQFGGNVRIVRNQRLDFQNAFDTATTNPSFYDLSGAVLTNAFTAAGYNIAGGDINTVQAAATSLIGRYSEYSGNFTFDLDGSILPQGTPINRNFATEEYDAYFQDVWKPYRNLTLTLGMRYSASRPVYEKNGFQVVPSERLGNFFDRRVASAEAGVPLNDLIDFELAGPANNGQGFYSMDWNNWQPRLAAAWSPNFKNKFLKGIFGGENDSVLRGGFAMTNDHFGGQLAITFGGLSPIGFTSSTTISANTYNVTDRPAPLFTGFTQDIRNLPGIPAPVQRFSTEVDPDCLAGLVACPQRIEASLDGTITTPTHYSWNVSWGRQLPKGMYFEASYIGRMARNLLATRDVMALNNIVDPVSGMDWYTAAGMVHDIRARDTDINAVQPIPYFENLFPGLGANFWGIPQWSSTQALFQIVARQDFTQPFGVCTDDGGNPVGCDFFNNLDWTFVQLLIDDLGTVPNMFFHPQYAAFSSFSTVGKSNYNAATFSLRQRLGETLSYDINYTFSKSLDNASGLETGSTGASGTFGANFILNPLRPEDSYAISDFDTTHSVNANFIFQLPVGKGRKWLGGINSFGDAILGGWQLAGIYRWNTGLPISVPIDSAQWATNWNAQSWGSRIRPIQIAVNRDTQNAFANAQDAFNSFRNARPGETGERNVLRLPGYSALDLGLGKSVKMPWGENHKLQLRWEVINVTNVQYFQVTGNDITRSSFGLPIDPEGRSASGNFGRIFSTIQGTPRRMQFGLRYSF